MEKVTRRFGLAEEVRGIWPTTPLAPSVTAKPATKGSKREEAGCLNYQAMVESTIYANIMTRPDVAKAAAVLSRFSHNPETSHEKAARQCILYLHGTSCEFEDLL